MADIVKSRNLHGYVTVQVFEGNKEVQKVTSHNMIYAAAEEELKKLTMASGIGKSCTEVTKPGYGDRFVDILLTSSTSEPVDKLYPDIGTVIGYSTQTTYSGADALRGTINTSETQFITSPEWRIHYVFDWPTHAANGTFQTLLWAQSYPLTCALLMSFGVSSYLKHGITCDGEKLWCTTNTYNDVSVYSLTGSLITTYPSPQSSPRGIAWDGQYIWLAVGSSPYRIYQMDPETWVYAKYIASPTTSPTGLSYANGYLWLAADSTTTYKIDPVSGSVVTTYTFPKTTYAITEREGYIYTTNSDKRLVMHDADTLNNLVEYAIPYDPPFHAIDFRPDGTFYTTIKSGSSYYFAHLAPTFFGAQSLLPEPVTKTAINTMKIQYDFVIE